jgi:hypothetical protein
VILPSLLAVSEVTIQHVESVRVRQELEREVRCGGFCEDLAADTREMQAIPRKHIVMQFLRRVGVHSVIINLVAQLCRQAKNG